MVTVVRGIAIARTPSMGIESDCGTKGPTGLSPRRQLATRGAECAAEHEYETQEVVR